jgi:hypothetical protein
LQKNNITVCLLRKNIPYLHHRTPGPLFKERIVFMRTHHLLASSLVLLLAVSASAQESMIEQGEPAIAVPPIHENHYGFYPSYASYQGLDMPGFCCGSHSPHVGHWGPAGHWGPTRHGRHCSACGSKHLHGGLFSQLRANRRGCPTCAATTCCDAGCCSSAIQKGPIQKGAVQKYAAAQKHYAPQHPVAYQKAYAPPTKFAPPRVWPVQKSPVVQKDLVVQKAAVQKSAWQKSAWQKSAWQKSTDCCTPPVSSGWRPRLHRCGRLHGAADSWDPCCTGGPVGTFSEPHYEYEPSPSDVEEGDSILIPPPPPPIDAAA